MRVSSEAGPDGVGVKLLAQRGVASIGAGSDGAGESVVVGLQVRRSPADSDEQLEAFCVEVGAS